MKLIGVITKDGFVRTEDGKLFELPFRGIDEEKYPKVLLDARAVGGSGAFKSQSIKPYIGMKVMFTSNNGIFGYNFEIIN